MVGEDGIEPPEPKVTDLQSAPLPTTEYSPITQDHMSCLIYSKYVV